MTARIIDLTAERKDRRPLRFASQAEALTQLVSATNELLDEVEPVMVVAVDEVWKRLDVIRAIATACLEAEHRTAQTP